jgi:hypothetical protein
MVDFLGQRLPNDRAVATAPPNTLRIDLEVVHWASPETAETSVQMVWRDPDVGGVSRVFRQIIPFVAQATPTGFQANELPRPEDLHFGWNVVAVMDDDCPGCSMSFFDKDIPPVNEGLPRSARRSLGALYCYRVEVTGGERDARSPVVCTRNRGINSPRVESVDAVSDSEIRVKWRDNSKLASGFQVRHYEQPDGTNKRDITMNGTARRDLIITNLPPDTEHVVLVRAWDFYGSSSWDSGSARTQPAPNADPDDRTFDVTLSRQEIGDPGHVPYLGRFPTTGDLPHGTLREVALLSQWPALHFVKPGHTTLECDDPDAVVRLAPGTSLTPGEMTELFGDGTPDLPIVFLACAEATSPLLDWIPIRITYRPT